MDIHKPKPWHGVREFLKEYVIIVVGVLTALGAEQGVEWLHWRHEVEAAREVLRTDYRRVLVWGGDRDGQSACVGKRLAELSEILERAAVAQRLPAVGASAEPTRHPWTLFGWDGVISGQILPHFPQEEARLHTANAHYIAATQLLRDEESREWVILSTLAGPGRRLESGEAANLRVSLRAAAQHAYEMRVASRGIARQILKTGILAREDALRQWKLGSERGRNEPICQALGASARNLLDNPSGASVSAPPSIPF